MHKLWSDPSPDEIRGALANRGGAWLKKTAASKAAQNRLKHDKLLLFLGSIVPMWGHSPPDPFKTALTMVYSTLLLVGPI